MNKKAESISLITWWLINLMLLAVVIIPPVKIINDFSNKRSIEKQIIAKDVALLADTIYASPNDLIYFYRENKFPFYINFTEERVVVYEKTEHGISPKSHAYIADENIMIGGKEISPVLVEGRKDESYFPLAFIKTDSVIETKPALKTSDILNDE